MLRVACIGAGYFSQFHFDGWQRIAETELVGVTNHERSKAEATGLPVYDDLTALLSEAQPDILDIIIPPDGHVATIRQALQHKLKVIICQKPFCTSLAEAEEMTALAAEAKIPLIVHENFRFQPWYRVISDQIAAGAIGRPLQATFRLRPGDGQGPEAYLARQPYFQSMPRFLIHETGVHWIDVFRFLFGNPTAVYADLRRVNEFIAGEDAGYVMLDHADGVRVLFDGNRCLDHAATNTRCTMGEGLFEGSAGTLILNGDGSVHLRAFDSLHSKEVLPPDTSGTFGGDCTYQLQAHVVRALMNGTSFENEAHEYLTVIKTENAIYRSASEQTKMGLDAL